MKKITIEQVKKIVTTNPPTPSPLSLLSLNENMEFGAITLYLYSRSYKEQTIFPYELGLESVMVETYLSVPAAGVHKTINSWGDLHNSFNAILSGKVILLCKALVTTNTFFLIVFMWRSEIFKLFLFAFID